MEKEKKFLQAKREDGIVKDFIFHHLYTGFRMVKKSGIRNIKKGYIIMILSMAIR